MKIPVATFLAVLSLSQACHRSVVNAPDQRGPTENASTPGEFQSENGVAFSLQNLDESLVDFANREYEQMAPDYSDPDNPVGTPPFVFVKRVECEVVVLDHGTETLIKKYSETVSFHAVVILKDARSDLYAFTVTSTVPDKREVQLRSFGPVTNENPDVVNLPISRRRLTEFPVDFMTGKPLQSDKGRCVFVPYPFPADQEYWLFSDNKRTGELQGLYRNDRYESVNHLIRVITHAVTTAEKS